MTTYKFLLLLLVSVMLSSEGSFAQQPSDCALRLSVELQQTAGSQRNDKAVIKVEGTRSKVKYLFYEKTKGDLLQHDFDKNYVEGLKKGTYVCVVAEDKGCTRQIEFEIQ